MSLSPVVGQDANSASHKRLSLSLEEKRVKLKRYSDGKRADQNKDMILSTALRSVLNFSPIPES